MRIGVIGGSGPAGSSLAARLASVGYHTIIGSRSRYRAMEALIPSWAAADLEAAKAALDASGFDERRHKVLAQYFDPELLRHFQNQE